jgi:pseudaminic acid synthase
MIRKKPFIVAEMSGNHNQSLDRAKEIIKAIADCGCDAVKLQTYTSDTITMEGVYTVNDEKSLWNGQELYDLYKLAYTPWEWHNELFRYAESLGLVCFSSPFDETSVDFLESIGCPIYKIASFENTHHPLIKKVALTKKPVIMSTGTANLAEVKEAVDVLRVNGCKDITLLKCTSTYPASPENSNLLTIPELAKIFPDCKIGLSDHTMGIGVALAAITLGAQVVEKHLTLKRADGGVDAAFSMEPQEMKALVEEAKNVFDSLGVIQLDAQSAELKSRTFKRSVYVSEDIKAGQSFTVKNVKVIRPAFGLAPKYFEEVLNASAKTDLKKGTPLTWEMIVK